MRKKLLIASLAVLFTMTLAVSSPARRGLAKISSPEMAAKTLYGAWKRNNRRAALGVATTAAVNKMFSSRYTGPDWEFNGCEKRAGGHDCFYRYEGGGVTMRVTGSQAAGYRVRSVSFVAD